MKPKNLTWKEWGRRQTAWDKYVKRTVEKRKINNLRRAIGHGYEMLPKIY